MTTEELLRSADEWLSAFHNKGGVTVPPGSYLDLIRDLAAALRAEQTLRVAQIYDVATNGTADTMYWKERAELAERERDEARAALAGVIGLVQLIASRGDLPPGLDDLMLLSHRMVDARAALGEKL